MKALSLVMLAALGGTAFADKDPTPQEQINKVMTDHAEDLRACYTKRLKVKTTLAGKMTVLITVEEKGNVSAVSVTVGLDDEVDACVTKTIKAFTFPAPGQQVKFKYPLDFKK